MLLLAGLLLPAMLRAQEQPKIVTLGADLNGDQRAALLGRFGAAEGVDTILTVTTDETRAASQQIIPVPEGYTSVSSTALTCGAAGSGVRVTTEHITRVSPAMYAGALLAAGVEDAELIVAAPADAEAEGMTALAGLFKGIESGACGRGGVEPTRRELAYRWLATTVALGDILGNQSTAANLVLRAQQALIGGPSGDPAVADQALNTAATETGVTIPAEQREPVLDLLRRLDQARASGASGTAGWMLEEISPTEVRLLPPGHPGTSAKSAPASTLNGVVRSAAAPGTPLVIEAPGQVEQLNLRISTVVVTRDGQPARLADLRAGDRIVLTLGPDKVVQRVEATSKTLVAHGSGGSGDVVVGTVIQNMEGQLALQTAPGEQEFTIPAGATIMREGRAAQLAAIKTNDSVVLVRDASGDVRSIFAQPMGNQYMVEGTTTGTIRDHHLEVRVGEQTLEVPLPAGEETEVTRNGRAARLDQIAANHRVQIRFTPFGRPVEVAARSAGPGSLLRSPWLLLFLLPLLLIPLAMWRGTRARALLVLPGRRRRVVDPDDIDGIRQP